MCTGYICHVWKVEDPYESGNRVQDYNGRTIYKYMTSKNDPQIQAILRHHNFKALHSVPEEAEKYLSEAGI